MHNGFHVGKFFECFYGFVCVCVGGGVGLSGFFGFLGLGFRVGLQWIPSGTIDPFHPLAGPTTFVPHCSHCPINTLYRFFG